MPETNIELIRGIYDAFAAGDVAGVLGRMSHDIVWNEAENFPYADGNPYIGPATVAKGVFARCIGEWDGFAVVVEEILVLVLIIVGSRRLILIDVHILHSFACFFLFSL